LEGNGVISGETGPFQSPQIFLKELSPQTFVIREIFLACCFRIDKYAVLGIKKKRVSYDFRI